MLAIQNFIFTHENWEELLAAEPYNLKIKWKDNLVMFNYDQIKSEHNNITDEARGLILNATDNRFTIVRMGFKRFYNYGEAAATQINWENAIVETKMDGTMIFFYFYNGQWHISTRSTFDASEASVYNTSLTFEQLTLKAMENSNVEFSELNTACTYVFELCAPENRVVVRYEEPALYYLMTRNNKTGIELVLPHKKWKKPASFNIHNLDKTMEFVSQFNGDEFEGVVVRDKSGNRIKVKNLNWLELHKIANNHNFTSADALTVYRCGDADEQISYFPERRELIESVVKCYESYLERARVLDSIDFKGSNPDKKEFALFVNKRFSGAFAALWFRAWDNRAEEWIKAMKSEDFVNKFYNE